MFDLYHDQISRCASMNGNLHFLGAMVVEGVCRQAGMHALVFVSLGFCIGRASCHLHT